MQTLLAVDILGEMLNSQLVLVSKLELAVAIPYRRAGALLHHIVTIFSIGQPNYSTRLEKECRRAILMFTLDAYCSVGEVYKF